MSVAIAPRRIAIVEDEALAAHDIGQIVSRLGHEVVGVAATADDGFRLIRDGRPDLVLLDIDLRSGVSGIDLARRIHGISPARIVFLTGQDDDQTRRRASSVAPLAFLLKPWSQARLRDVLSLAQAGSGDFVEVPRLAVPFLEAVRPAPAARHPATLRFLAYCAQCSPPGAVPARAAVDPTRIAPLLPSLFILEPTDGGREWIVRLMGTALAEHAETDLTAKRLLARLDPRARSAVRRWCALAVRADRPLLFHAGYAGRQLSYQPFAPELVVTPMLGRDGRSRWLFGGIFL